MGLKDLHDRGKFEIIRDLYRNQYWEVRDSDSRRSRYLGKAGANSLYFEGTVPSGFESYGKPLLQLEVDAAKHRHPDQWQDQSKSEIVLVLLIGTSFDPLLQTVWRYQPKRILPVLNTYYNAPEGMPCYVTPRTQWEDFKSELLNLPTKIVAKFEDERWLENPYAPENLVKDDPASVFAFLHKELKDDLTDNQELVIDITGAKKSMIGGAYLYAAYRRARISYVDFEIYDSEVGRPYGYTCNIHEQPNPFEKFSLQAWEQIEEFYREYNFSAAAALLADMNPDQFANLYVAFNSKKTKDDAQTVFIPLLKYLQICQDWERGALFEAKSNSNTLGGPADSLTLPTAIEQLGDYWTTDSDSRVRFDFLTDPAAIIYYAKDELERAQWYAGMPEKRQREGDFQPDYRSAFLRAYALHETLLKSRVLLMFKHNKLRNNRGRLYEDLDNTTQREWEKWLAGRWQTVHSRSLLEETAIEVTYRGKGLRRVNCSDCLMNTIETHLEIDRDDWNAVESLRELGDRRNEIAHMYVHVTPELAQDAIMVATNNLNHFRNKWLEKCLDNKVSLSPEPVVYVSPWEEVKKAFGLEFLISPRG